MRQQTFPTALLLGLLIAAPCLAGDWPMWRCDAQRGAACSEELPAKLHVQWIREYPAPRPAFPTEVRLCYDASYEPVVLGGTMFVPSMVSDSVEALDAGSGARRWCAFADGPVRFAPVAWQDKLYFVSDDGHLYCLSAADGKLLWRFRGLPADRADRKLLGNGRLISLYPARGGPVLADGIVYFAAGIWPSAGVFLHALDAETGRVVWSNTDSHHIAKANLDHGVETFAGLTPQGYLAVLGEKLAVPCGAQLPGFLDRKTGKLASCTMGWGGRVGLPKGTWFLAGTAKYLAHGGDLYDMSRPNDEQFQDSRGGPDFKRLLYPGGFTRLQIEPTCQRELGQFGQPVLAPEAMVCSTPGGIAGFDLSKPELRRRADSKPSSDRSNDKYPDKWLGTFPELWRLGSKLKVHIKAGSRLYAGGPGAVAAIDVPEGPGKATVSWRAQIEGEPHRMLAADGKLFVVTLQGRIYAFGEKEVPQPAVHRGEPRTAPHNDQWAEHAALLLKETGAAEGYALVLGMGSGRLAEELVRQSQLHVIGIDPDPRKVETLRSRFHQAGIYGTRVSVHAGDPLSFPLPPYLATLIVSEDPTGILASPGAQRAGRIFHPLRPYGGTACLPVSGAEQEAMIREFSAQKLPGLAMRRNEGMLLVTRAGPLPGAAGWTHEGANAENTGASGDQLVRAPLELLWFDGSIRWFRTPGSNVVRIAGGRLLIRAGTLRAIDVYTGRRMWEARLPSAGGAGPGDLAAADDAVYAAAGQACLVLDPATGKRVREIPTPKEVAGPAGAVWSNLRVSGDDLVAGIGRHVVCLDRHSGRMRWSHAAPQARLSLAVGGGKVFCSELPQKTPRGKPAPPGKRLQTLALDLKTGDLLWQVDGGSQIHYSEPHDRLVTAAGIFRGKDGRRLGDSHAAWCIAGDRLVCGTKPDSIEVYDLLSGARSGDPLQWFRRGCTGLRASRHLVTTRFGGNAAYVDLQTRRITPIWNVRSGCHNNLFPADGVLNMPNLTGGCECNYTPTSLALVPASVIPRGPARGGAPASE